MAVDKKLMIQPATKSELAELAGTCAVLAITISQLCDEVPQNERVKNLDREFRDLFEKFDNQFDALTGWTPDEV